MDRDLQRRPWVGSAAVHIRSQIQQGAGDLERHRRDEERAVGPPLAQVRRDILDILRTRHIKTTVFLKSMDSFVAMNEVYGRPEYFGSNPPARSTVEVARLPRDVLVEIEVLALV